MPAVFQMPPEAEPWKQAIVVWTLIAIGLAAIGKMLWDCYRPTAHRIGTSFLLAILSVIGFSVLVRCLKLDDARESLSSMERTEWAINAFALVAMNIAVTALTSGAKRAGTRFGIATIGGMLTCLWMFSWTLTLSGARIVAPRLQCRINAQELGESLLKMSGEKRALPAPTVMENDVFRSWRVELLPWTSQRSLRAKYQDERPWDHAETNAAIARTECSIYRCPCSDARTNDQGFAVSDFAAVTGPGTVWSDESRKKFPDVPDGASSTVLIVEASGQKIAWPEPRDVDVSQVKPGVNLPAERRGESLGLASGYHAGGCHVTFADGHARFLSASTDSAVLKALTTAGNGDQVDDF